MEIKEEYVDGNTIVESKEEAKALLKSCNYKIRNGNVDSFVSLQGINKFIQMVFKQFTILI